MTRLLVACCVASLLTTASPAETLRGYAELDRSNVYTFDPRTFTVGPNVDFWHVMLENTGSQDATRLELSFPGSWMNTSVQALSFRYDVFPCGLCLNEIAETFFVLPDRAGSLEAVGTIDTDELLESSYTVAEDTVLVPAGGEPTVVAVLALLTGEPVDATRFTGRGAVGGEFIEIAFPVPEPSAACCVAIALVSAALVRTRTD